MTLLRGILLLLCLQAVTCELRIGAFNIQTFGKSKSSKEHIMVYIEKIVRRYDIILVQEIRDSSGSTIQNLLDVLNEREGEEWSVAYSERLGRASYKEQYAYYYRSDRVTLISTYQFDDGPDNGSDWFAREPFGCQFYSQFSSVPYFGVMGIHVAPDEAVEELSRLHQVLTSSQQYWNNANVILMGDFNADCSYVSSKDWTKIVLREDDSLWWVVDDNEDTTVSVNTDCAYDRIVVAGSSLQFAINRQLPAVFRFDEEYDIEDYDLARDISDHYPVEVSLS